MKTQSKMIIEGKLKSLTGIAVENEADTLAVG